MASNVNVGIKFKADAGNVPSVVAGIQQSVKGIAPADAGGNLDALTRRVADLGQISQQVTGALSNVSGFLRGMAGGALDAASNFESLRAKLVSVSGSIEEANKKFEFATAFAAKTPFDVKGVVDATAVITGFGLKAEEVLPAAANLAAAMGTELSHATLTVGKAASGSLEGFQSLRDVYAITSSELKKFGVQVNSTGGILAQTPPQIEKNRAALLALIKVKFGDAIERQSETLKGALSNLGDTGTQLVASFGETLIPMATAGARAVTSFIGVVNNIGPGAKTAIAGVVALGAAVSVIGVGVAGAVTGLLVLQGQLLAISATMAVEFPAAAAITSGAAGFVGVALKGVTGAAGLARTALLSIASANPILLATLAIVTGLSFAADNYAKKQKAAGDAVTSAGNKFAQANTTLKQTISTLNDAGREVGVSVGIVAKSRDQFAQLANAFNKLSPEQVVRAFAKAGESTESLKDKLRALENGAGTVQTKLKLLAQAREGISTGDLESFARARDALKEYGIEVDSAVGTLGRMDDVQKGLNLELNRIGQAKTAVGGVIKAFEQFAEPLEKATADSKALGSFLDLSKQVGTAQALAGALEAVNTQIKANVQTAGVGTDNLDKLLEKLKDPTASDIQKNAIREQIALVQQRTSLEEADAKRRDGIVQTQIDAMERTFNRKKALNQTQLADELSLVNQELALVRVGSDQEIALLERKNSIIKAQRDAQLEGAKTSFQQLQQANQQSVDVGRESVDRTGQLKGLDEAINRTNAWRDANRDLVAKFPELARELGQLERSQGMARQAEQAKIAKENVSLFVSALSTDMADATTSIQKLATAQAGISGLQSLRKSGLVDESASQDAINNLTKTKLQLEHAIADEKRAQQDALKSVEQQNLEGEISALEARKSAGANVDRELEQSRAARVQGQLDALEREKQAAIKATGDITGAEEIASAKRNGIIGAETLRRFQELQAQTKNVDGALSAQEKRHAQHFARIGGGASPLQSFEEAFNGPNSFSFGDGFNLGELRQPRGGLTSPNFSRLRSKVASEFAKPGAAGPVGGASSTAVTNNNLTVNGSTVNDPALQAMVEKIIDSRIKTDRHKKGNG